MGLHNYHLCKLFQIHIPNLFGNQLRYIRCWGFHRNRFYRNISLCDFEHSNLHLYHNPYKDCDIIGLYKLHYWNNHYRIRNQVVWALLSRDTLHFHLEPNLQDKCISWFLLVECLLLSSVLLDDKVITFHMDLHMCF